MIGEKSKHAKLRYHYVREQCRDGLIKFEWVDSKHQLADFLTKPLARAAFSHITNTVMGANKIQDEMHQFEEAYYSDKTIITVFVTL